MSSCSNFLYLALVVITTEATVVFAGEYSLIMVFLVSVDFLKNGRKGWNVLVYCFIDDHNVSLHHFQNQIYHK